ncbi:hypothetical protein PR048_018640 [Dryococelus australis]|uniref:Uncharacterized protein n=1 Tax=Dryococelus australis TaxID=614101 RepID=A0ABQ9HCT9_9NEOP|nr:hypothetical protein PR048_018640 [Dryococelus australis]
MKYDYDKHKIRENESNTAKANDKKRSETDPIFLPVTFDLQYVLQMIPDYDRSQMYYSCKICVYNLALNESSVPKDAFCISWSEFNGKRDSCEVENSGTEVSLLSDTCGSQNRYQNIAALFLYVVQKMHINNPAILTWKQTLCIVYSMIDCLNIFRTARSSQKRYDARPYTVK